MTRENYIKRTMEHNVFFARIFKEHCVTVASCIQLNDMRIIQSLDRYKVHFEMLLLSSLEMGLGLIDKKILDSGCMVSQFTYACEQNTQNTCGISINHRISGLETELLAKPPIIAAGRLPSVYERALKINFDGIELAQGMTELLGNILKEIKNGKMYSFLYPSVFDCLIMQLTRFQNEKEFLKEDKGLIVFDTDAAKIMQTNAEYIRGMLDPCEMDSITQANHFAGEFSQICREPTIEKFADVNSQFAQFVEKLLSSVLNKKALSIMLPLTCDNILRQARYNCIKCTTPIE